MRQSEACITPVVIADPDVTQPAPGNAMLNVAAAWQYSTGSGVSVAIIDTGVTPNPRFGALFAGGDYVQGLPNGGLTDCDNHGTVVASIIAAAPSNPAARPAPKPAGVGGPPPPPGRAGQSRPDQPAASAAAALDGDGDRPAAPSAAATRHPEGDAPADGAATPAPRASRWWLARRRAAPDGVVGVAPDATLISIRQSSAAFSPAHPTPEQARPAPQGRRFDVAGPRHPHRRRPGRQGDQRVAGVVHQCRGPGQPGPAGRGGALRRGGQGRGDRGRRRQPQRPDQRDCGQNPAFNPLNVDDPRDWDGVRTIVSPAWFSDYVLSVAAVTPEGLPMPDSINGPWVGVAAPGSRIIGLVQPQRCARSTPHRARIPGTGNGIWGTSFSAAYVSGVAALVRAKYPNLTAHQVIRRIMETAHNPARRVDNQVGHGVVDPVAALTFDVAPGDPKPAEHLSSALHVPPPPPGPDLRPRNVALLGAGAVVLAAGVIAGVVAIRRRMS